MTSNTPTAPGASRDATHTPALQGAYDLLAARFVEGIRTAARRQWTETPESEARTRADLAEIQLQGDQLSYAQYAASDRPLGRLIAATGASLRALDADNSHEELVEELIQLELIARAIPARGEPPRA